MTDIAKGVGVTLRPATDADRDAVLDLGVIEEAAWFGEPEVGADEVGEWIDDEGGLTRGVVAADGGGSVRGFASPGRRESVFLADPASTDALADALLPWLREQRDAVQLMAFAPDAACVTAVERPGLRHVRPSFSMVRPGRAGPRAAAAAPCSCTRSATTRRPGPPGSRSTSRRRTRTRSGSTAPSAWRSCVSGGSTRRSARVDGANGDTAERDPRHRDRRDQRAGCG